MTVSVTNFKSEITQNETNYKTIELKISNTIYNVLIVSGKSNYITVYKVTSNPFLTLGKQFNNFNEAIKNYKNENLKIGLLKIQSGIY